MTMHDEYFEYCAEYTKKYGEKTVVLIECGSFMEIYAIINDTYKLGPDIQVICDILNIQLSRKNKAITQVDHSNPFMAGFPSYCLDKHSQILVSTQQVLTVTPLALTVATSSITTYSRLSSTATPLSIAASRCAASSHSRQV